MLTSDFQFLRKSLSVLALALFLTAASHSSLSAQQLIVNEYYNADASADEWVELLVNEKTDFSGWKLNDYNADGNVQNELTFSTAAFWTDLPAGTLVLITGDDVDIAPDTDPADGQVILRASNSTYFDGSMVDISESSDGIRVRDIDDNFVFGLSHGRSVSNSSFVNNSFTALVSQSSLGFYNTTESNHFTNAFYTKRFDTDEVTPGAGNDAANTRYIDQLRANRTDIPRLEVIHKSRTYSQGSTLYFPKLTNTEVITQTVYLTNAGEPELIVDSLKVSGEGYSALNVTAPDTLAQHDTVSFEVQLSPSAVTSYQGLMQIYSNDAVYDVFEITLETRSELSRDQTFEAVTWNIEWFGSASAGPDNDNQQIENVAKVIDSLQADLYALQEISDEEDFRALLASLESGPYRGFMADYISQQQKTAYIFNSETIDSVRSGAIEDYQDIGDWAGRLPFLFEFRARFNGKEYPAIAVNIHAKAFDDQDSYEKRTRAAADLYEYFDLREKETRIIFLGDYNDDVDASIYNNQESPYEPFVVDEQNFNVITGALSEAGEKSMVSDRYDDMVDHITISDELFASYLQSSASVFVPSSVFINDYGETTSDHYPVWAKFDFTTLTDIGERNRENELPNRVTLDQNYPNPFNPSTQITFELPAGNTVDLTVFDMLGREVTTLISNRRLSAGSHTVEFEGSGLASGIYIYRLELANGKTLMRKMTLIK